MIHKTILFNPTGATGNTNYNFTVLLTAENQDLGFFDTYSGFTGSTGITGTTIHTVTGTSSSRISELTKYVVTTAPWDKFYLSSGLGIDGVNLALSNTGGTGGFYIYTYYIGTITYVDSMSTESGTTAITTTFTFQSFNFGDTNNFNNLPILKLESKQNMSENPIVGTDVDIIRQDIPVFELSVRLRGTNKLSDVLTYGGSVFYTIYNNS